jgi:hypothetical protein
LYDKLQCVIQYEELETLYACVSKYAFEGLATYEKSAAGGGAGALLGPLMMLKACCTSSPAYIDRLLLPLMRVLQRMARDHVAPNPDTATSDLLVTFLFILIVNCKEFTSNISQGDCWCTSTPLRSRALFAFSPSLSGYL